MKDFSGPGDRVRRVQQTHEHLRYLLQDEISNSVAVPPQQIIESVNLNEGNSQWQSQLPATMDFLFQNLIEGFGNIQLGQGIEYGTWITNRDVGRKYSPCRAVPRSGFPCLISRSRLRRLRLHDGSCLETL